MCGCVLKFRIMALQVINLKLFIICGTLIVNKFFVHELFTIYSEIQAVNCISTLKCELTREAINGAAIEPILAHIEPEPTPTFLTTVGNSSPEYR